MYYHSGLKYAAISIVISFYINSEIIQECIEEFPKVYVHYLLFY